jgi:predicted RNA binding protein YcfA (HicA-like mRNA interferase family)
MSVKINSILPSRTKDLIKHLESLGYAAAHQKGSHLTFKKSNCQTLTIVNCKDQSTGTLRNIAKLLLGDEYYSK